MQEKVLVKKSNSIQQRQSSGFLIQQLCLSHFSVVPASLAHDAFHYYLSQAIGGFISCKLMQHTASKFSIFLFIQTSHVLDGMPSCCVLSQRLRDMLRKERWAGLGRNGPHSTCVTPTRRLPLFKLFEAALIPAFRIKPMKKG